MNNIKTRWVHNGEEIEIPEDVIHLIEYGIITEEWAVLRCIGVESKYLCKKCGTEVSKDEGFCYNCGTQLNNYIDDLKIKDYLYKYPYDDCDLIEWCCSQCDRVITTTDSNNDFWINFCPNCGTEFIGVWDV